MLMCVRSSVIRCALFGSSLVWVGACKPPSPPVLPTAPAPVVEKKEPPVDTSPVAEPPGLVVVGRIAKPDALLSTLGSFAHLPLPAGRALVRSLADDSVAEVVDLSQPIDAVVTMRPARRGADPLVAFSVAVASFADAKTKLAAGHRLVRGTNGVFKIEGLRLSDDTSARSSEVDPRDRSDEDDNHDDAAGCVLAPSSKGARIVCGEPAALEALTPYLSRTLPRETWSSDVHVEVRPEPLRAPLAEARAALPALAAALSGSGGTALRSFVDAAIGEVVDVADDVQKLAFDVQVADSGIVATTRFDFRSTKSTVARVQTRIDLAESPPAAFWHLPSDTDTAFFGRSGDAKLFDRPRELMTNLLVEALDSKGMPKIEQSMMRELLSERMLSLFSNGTSIYAKGFDQAGVEKVIAAERAVKPDDRAGAAEAKRLVIEQLVGWHLYRSSEPVAKVGPMLKAWSALWNRPDFSKWARSINGDAIPRLRIAPLPAGVTLPKETVHLEVTIPRTEYEAASAPAHSSSSSHTRAPAMTSPTPAKMARKPFVFHVFAVPDGSATWLAFGLDGKLVAHRAGVALASAPEANTLGTMAGYETLRDAKTSGGGIATLRGLAVIAALDASERSLFAELVGLPHGGATPMVFDVHAEAPSAAVKAGSSVSTLRLPRAFIEDVATLASRALAGGASLPASR